jgi:hypothetical protein
MSLVLPNFSITSESYSRFYFSDCVSSTFRNLLFATGGHFAFLYGFHHIHFCHMTRYDPIT